MALPAQPFFSTPEQRTALARQRFFDEGQRPTGLIGESVIQSWHRCVSARRAAREAVDFDPVSAVRAQTVAMRSRAVLTAARTELVQLEQALADTGCRVFLTDGQGVVVHVSTGRAGPDQRVLSVAARVGVSLAEGAIGTNGPGLVLHTGQVSMVLGGEHYFERVQGMHCAAAPVHDASGRVIAVLDLSIENRPFDFDAMAMVALYATAIENRYLTQQANDAIVLSFQASPGLLGTPLEGLAAIGHDHRVHWANAAARRLLTADAVGRLDEEVFGLDTDHLLALTRRPAPVLLHLPTGLGVWLRARWKDRRLAGSGDTGPPGPPGPPIAAMPQSSPSTPPARPARTLAEHDHVFVARTLQACGGNIAEAARRLGVSRGLLYRRLRQMRQP